MDLCTAQAEARHIAHTSAPSAAAAVMQAERKSVLDARRPLNNTLLVGSHEGSQKSRTSPAWPTGARRSTALEGDPHAREKAEDAIRPKWLGELRAIVTQAELPVVTIAASMRDPDALLSSLGRGRRARTLRRRIWD